VSACSACGLECERSLMAVCACGNCAQIVRTWRDLGLVHGDIKPHNVMIKLPKLSHTYWLHVKDVCGSMLDGVMVFLADVEGAAVLPQQRCGRGRSAGTLPALSGVHERVLCGDVVRCGLQWHTSSGTVCLLASDHDYSTDGSPRGREMAPTFTMQPMEGVPLQSFTPEYLADPANPVGTTVSDMFAVGCTVVSVVDVRGCACRSRDAT
jgi:hypothetical protein